MPPPGPRRLPLEAGHRSDPRRVDGHCLPRVSPAELGRKAIGVVGVLFAGNAGETPDRRTAAYFTAWPFIGGKLAPPPPRPPTRELVIEQVGEKLEIVRRGEIPTVHVPRRADPGLPDETAVPTHPGPMEEKQCAHRDRARDPP